VRAASPRIADMLAAFGRADLRRCDACDSGDALRHLRFDHSGPAANGGESRARFRTLAYGGSAMSHYDRNGAAAQYGRPLGGAEAAVVDEGLRAYMLRIYNYMVLGLAITGFAALGIYLLSVTSDPAAAAKVVRGGVEAAVRVSATLYLTPLGYALFVSPLKWLLFLAPLALVFFLSFRIDSMRPQTALVAFWIYAALVGVSLGSIFLVYTHTSVVRVFFITAASFGGLSLWGYTTQRDLTGMGSFLIMGLFGIIIASLVNVFLGSSTMQWLISILGVLIFAGLTAWDTQRLKNEYVAGTMLGEALEKSAIMGALSLYLDFLNLFVMLLQLLGQRQE
jgi:FtsH-binding integral membrane protein